MDTKTCTNGHTMIGIGFDECPECEAPWKTTTTPSAENASTPNYSHLSHSHCWDQKQPSACGIPLEKHKQCCLCDMQYHASTPTWEEGFEEMYAYRNTTPPIVGDNGKSYEEDKTTMIAYIHRIEQEAYKRGLAEETDLENSPWAKAFEAQIREDERRKVVDYIKYELPISMRPLDAILEEARIGSKSEGV